MNALNGIPRTYGRHTQFSPPFPPPQYTGSSVLYRIQSRMEVIRATNPIIALCPISGAGLTSLGGWRQSADPGCRVLRECMVNDNRSAYSRLGKGYRTAGR